VSYRQTILAAALLFSAWLAIFGSPEGGVDADPRAGEGVHTDSEARRGERPNLRAEASEPILTIAQRRSPTFPPTSLFSIPRVQPPVVVPVVQPVPVAEIPVPTAPPLPFHYLGKKLDEKGWEIFLAQGQQIQIVRVGQHLGDSYLVERIDPTELTLIYIPLSQKQTLPIGTDF
jgi:hypothetical protein